MDELNVSKMSDNRKHLTVKFTESTIISRGGLTYPHNGSVSEALGFDKQEILFVNIFLVCCDEFLSHDSLELCLDLIRDIHSSACDSSL